MMRSLLMSSVLACGGAAPLVAVNPATGEQLVQVSSCDEHDIDLAVRAARRAFESGSWPLVDTTGASLAMNAADTPMAPGSTPPGSLRRSSTRPFMFGSCAYNAVIFLARSSTVGS